MQRPHLVLAIAGIAIASVCLGASAHGADRHDPHSDANQHEHDEQLSPDTRRALRRFDEQKHRDYRRLGQQHFDSHRPRERAYRELRQKHRDSLRDILGESRLDKERFRDHRDEDDHGEHHGGKRHGDHDAARAFDPAAVTATLAARWALNESDRGELVDILEDYQEDAQKWREEYFDSPEERREAQRELEEGYRNDLQDILDDVPDADVNDVLERVLQ